MAGNRVGPLMQDNFGNFRLASRLVSLNATGDALFFSVPFGQFTVRRIRVRNPSASVTGAALGIWTAASQGGTNIVANVTLSSLSANLTYTELTLVSGVNTTIYTNATTFYVNVGTASVGNTLYIDLYGDPVTDQL